ncbi:MAG: N-acetyltransferase family protein [Gemmatimonadota bacterium]
MTPGSDIDVVPVRTTAEREAFIRLPWSLYRGLDAWVPPLLGDMRSRTDPDRHPFYGHSDARLYLALRGGRPVGRIAAIHNRNHVAFHDEPVGFFGFFESVDDADVSEALFEAAAGWLRDRGLNVMRGPTSYSTNEESGLLVEGFERPPAILMPYNPRYYEKLVTGAGFEEAATLVAYHLADNRPPDWLERISGRVRERTGVRIRPLRMSEFERELERIQSIYNAAWERNWGFVPMTDAEFEHMADELEPVLEPDLALIAEDASGDPVGFSLALPDLNEAIRHANGRLFPFGLLKILWHARRIRMARVITLGLVEAYRGRGVDGLLYLETFRNGADHGITEGEFSWVLEDNEPMRKPLERMGARVYKRYRIYDRPL